MPQGSWAGTSQWGSGHLTEKPRSPHSQSCHELRPGHISPSSPFPSPSHTSVAAPIFAHLQPFAHLPAISIPVVHLHLDGPVRQRACGGRGLTLNPCSLRTGPFSCSWAKRGCGDSLQKVGGPSHAPRPLIRGSSPRDKETTFRLFSKGLTDRQPRSYVGTCLNFREDVENQPQTSVYPFSLATPDGSLVPEGSRTGYLSGGWERGGHHSGNVLLPGSQVQAVWAVLRRGKKTAWRDCRVQGV